MRMARREWLAGTLPGLGLLLAEPARAEPAAEKEFTGTVVPLADLLKLEKVELDAEAGAHWLALKEQAGGILPLVKNGASLPLFRDAELRHRPVRLAGRRVLGSFLDLRQFWVLKNGRPHTVRYWCEVCAIQRHALEQTKGCECCGGPMERKEEPAD